MYRRIASVSVALQAFPSHCMCLLRLVCCMRIMRFVRISSRAFSEHDYTGMIKKLN